ncbi:MAG: hypothetical protein OFPI_38090 [Osedax symbiont Rs2]|nr:MAG: hypothetical protein OFPI_38090 [Osedax symbiont Rs2]
MRPYRQQDVRRLLAIAAKPLVVNYLPDDPMSLSEVEDVAECSITPNQRNQMSKIEDINLLIVTKATVKRLAA